jgi:hypothetical protein
MTGRLPPRPTKETGILKGVMVRVGGPAFRKYLF